MPQRFNARLLRGAQFEAPIAPRRAYAILGVLLFVQVANIADRELLFILLEPIQQDLGTTDTQMGLLTGFAFTLFYVIAGIPLARIADRSNRRNLLAICVSVWSAATMVCGVVSSYWQLLLARIGVATGEAAAGPSAQSMLADVFPAEQRTRAIGIFFSGASAGHFFGLYLGGLIAQFYGWGVSFLVFGAAGFVLTAAIWWFVPEPPRGLADAQAADPSPAPSMLETLRFLLRQRAFIFLMIAFTCTNIGSIARLAWGPTFVARVHDLPLSEIGLWLGLASSIGPAVGNIVSGAITDRLIRITPRWYGRVPALCMLLVVPFSLGFIYSDSPYVAIAFMLPAAFFLGAGYAPCAALMLALAKPRMRATAVALATLITTIIAGSVGPFLVGFLNDLLAAEHGDMAIRISFLVLPVMAAVSVVFYLAMGRTIESDLQRVSQQPTATQAGGAGAR